MFLLQKDHSILGCSNKNVTKKVELNHSLRPLETGQEAMVLNCSKKELIKSVLHSS